MGELVEAEVGELAGPKGKHDAARAVYRHGSESGKVTLGGRRVPVRRPRVRTVAEGDEGEREVRLESYDTFASVDLLADHMVSSMLAGRSGRRYRQALEPVGERLEASSSGTSQSSISRRFITATAERLAAFRARPLEGERWLIVFVGQLGGDSPATTSAFATYAPSDETLLSGYPPSYLGGWVRDPLRRVSAFLGSDPGYQAAGLRISPLASVSTGGN